MFATLSRFSSLASLGERLPTRDLVARSLSSLRNPRALLEDLGEFLRICYTDGVRALIAGKYSRRQAAYIMISALPALLGVALVTVPALLFPNPGNQALYHFAHTLSNDPASLLPTVIGTISTTLGFRLPLG